MELKGAGGQRASEEPRHKTLLNPGGKQAGFQLSLQLCSHTHTHTHTHTHKHTHTDTPSFTPPLTHRLHSTWEDKSPKLLPKSLQQPVFKKNLTYLLHSLSHTNTNTNTHTHTHLI